jgi:predicted amidohydrolase
MAERLLIAAAQINCTVGDLSANAARILEYAERARAAGADLVLTPEMALSGYPAEDLVGRAIRTSRPPHAWWRSTCRGSAS